MALYSTFLTEINNIYHLSFDQSSFIVLKHSNLGVLNYDFITTSLSPLHESTQPPPLPPSDVHMQFLPSLTRNIQELTAISRKIIYVDLHVRDCTVLLLVPCQVELVQHCLLTAVDSHVSTPGHQVVPWKYIT